MRSFSFDGFSALYDQTRTVDPTCFAAALDWIVARFPPAQFRSLLEAGVGTGRIALPLAERGYQVIGADISAEMLNVCTARNRSSKVANRLHCVCADTVSLPFPAKAFDLCFAVHLFYFIPEWRQAVQEMLRVLRPEGALILLHTGFGAEVPRLNARYRELAQYRGYAFPAYGVHSTAEVVDYAAWLGCQVEQVQERSWEWTSTIGLQEALLYLNVRAYSFTNDVPKEVHQAVMTTLYQEAIQNDYRESADVHVPNRVSIVIVSPSGATH